MAKGYAMATAKEAETTRHLKITAGSSTANTGSKWFKVGSASVEVLMGRYAHFHGTVRGVDVKQKTARPTATVRRRCTGHTFFGLGRIGTRQCRSGGPSFIRSSRWCHERHPDPCLAAGRSERDNQVLLP